MVTHPALVSEADFVRAQKINAVPAPADATVRRYLLTGLVLCGVCGRRVEAHWVHRRPGYRCRHGRTTANGSHRGRNPNLYWREDVLIQQVTVGARELFGRRPTDVAAYLRRKDMTITACPDGITVDPPMSAQATPQQKTAKGPRLTHQKNEIGGG
jgi:hypothetical protein